MALSEATPQSGADSLSGVVPTPPADPAWNGWDLAKLLSITIVALAISMIGVLLAARSWGHPHRDVAELARNAVVVVLGQGIGYLIVFAYMYVLVTRERRRPDFLDAIHWNWPANPATYLMWGVVLSVALQALAHLLPIPKDLPIDNFFRTPAEAWVVTIFGIAVDTSGFGSNGFHDVGDNTITRSEFFVQAVVGTLVKASGTLGGTVTWNELELEQ